jgi:hypothetical protein
MCLAAAEEDRVDITEQHFALRTRYAICLEHGIFTKKYKGKEISKQMGVYHLFEGRRENYGGKHAASENCSYEANLR